MLRGYFESGSITPGSTTAWILYDSLVYVTAGSTITLLGGAEYPTPPATDLLPPPDSYYRTGYRITPNAPNVTGAGETIAGATTIKATITAPEPIRLLIKSTGYGPLGARKQLESVIQKNYFNGLGAPSPLTLIGPPCTPVATCTAPAPTSTWIAPNFIFNPGTSAPTVYDGHALNCMHIFRRSG